jgi:hypothetical protein
VGGEACLVSNGERAYFTGDALHDPVQVTRPELHLPGCDDLETPLPPAGALLRRINDEGALLFPARLSWHTTGTSPPTATTLCCGPATARSIEPADRPKGRHEWIVSGAQDGQNRDALPASLIASAENRLGSGTERLRGDELGLEVRALLEESIARPPFAPEQRRIVLDQFSG